MNSCLCSVEAKKKKSVLPQRDSFRWTAKAGEKRTNAPVVRSSGDDTCGEGGDTCGPGRRKSPEQRRGFYQNCTEKATVLEGFRPRERTRFSLPW